MEAIVDAAIHGTRSGLIAGGVLAAVFLAAARIEPETMLRGYPPDIRDAYGPRRFGRSWVGIVAGLLAGAAVVAAAVTALLAVGTAEVVPTFVALASVLVTVQLVDLLVLDWLVFVRLRPAFVVLPGTEGLAGYDDLGFHVRGFVRATVASVVIAAVTAVALVGISSALS